MQRGGKKSGSKNRLAKPKSYKPLPSQPPKFEYKTYFRKTIRYNRVAQTGVQANISFVDLMQMINVGLTASSTNSALSAIRIKYIALWQTGEVTGPGIVSLEASNSSAGNIGSRPTLISDTSNNESRIAKIKYVPSKETAHGSWQNVITTATTTGAQVLFQILANIGDTMDIRFEAYLNIGDTILTNAAANTIPAIGALGYSSLPASGAAAWNATM